MTIMPSFKYRFKDLLKSSAMYFAIFILAVALIMGLSVYVNDGYFNVSAYEFSACVTVFVFGIVCARDDLRLGIQNGVSRRTVYYASLLSAVLISLILAVAGELLGMLLSALTVNISNVSAMSFFQMLYTDESLWLNAPLVLHLKSILLIFALILAGNQTGSFISLMFFRLNKMWTIIVAVGVPIFIGNLLPELLIRSGIDIAGALEKVFYTSATTTIFFAVWGIAFAVFNRLLMLRITIKPAAK